MARVVRRGGYVMAQDFDSDQTVVDASDQSLARRAAEVLDAAVPNPWIGRQLFALFRRTGRIDVRVVSHAIALMGASGFALYRQLNQGTIARAVNDGHISPAEEAEWWAELEQAAAADTFCSRLTGPRRRTRAAQTKGACSNGFATAWRPATGPTRSRPRA